MLLTPPAALEFTPLNGVTKPECLDDIVMQLDALSSPDAYDIAANHIAADYLLCLALRMAVVDANDSSVNNIITAFNRIKKVYE